MTTLMTTASYQPKWRTQSSGDDEIRSASLRPQSSKQALQVSEIHPAAIRGADWCCACSCRATWDHPNSPAHHAEVLPGGETWRPGAAVVHGIRVGKQDRFLGIQWNGLRPDQLVKQVDRHLRAPLHEAALVGHTKVVIFLVEWFPPRDLPRLLRHVRPR
jgi:hypothetical protein